VAVLGGYWLSFNTFSSCTGYVVSIGGGEFLSMISFDRCGRMLLLPVIIIIIIIIII
jgi:hypothetical protein